MMNKNSNTVQAFWVGIGSISSFAISIISAMILARYLNKHEYGTYKQIIYVYTTFLVVFTAGLPKVFSYFLPRYNLMEGKNITWKISKLLFILGCLFSVFLFLCSDNIGQLLNNEELGVGLKYFSPIPMFLLPTLGIEEIFATYKKTYFIALYNIMTRFIMLLLIIFPVLVLKSSYKYAIIGWILSAFVIFVIAFYYKNIPFKEVLAIKTNLTYKEIFSYSLPIVTASLAGIALKAADQFFISRYFGTEVFAEFSNGFIEIPFVTMVTNATSTVLMPILSNSIYKKEELDSILMIWKNTLLKSAIIIYPIVSFFVLYSEDIMIFLYSKTYIESSIYFRIAMLLNFFNIIIFAPLLLALGRTKFYSIVHVFFALGLWITEYLIVIYFKNSILIAACSVSFAIAKVVIVLIYLSRYLNIKVHSIIPFTDIGIILLHSSIALSLTCLFAGILFPAFPLIFKLAIDALLYIIILIITAKYFKINYYKLLEPLLGNLALLKWLQVDELSKNEGGRL